MEANGSPDSAKVEVTPVVLPYNEAQLKLAEDNMQYGDKHGPGTGNLTKGLSDNWAAALRYKIKEAVHKEKHQVLVDRVWEEWE